MPVRGWRLRLVGLVYSPVALAVVYVVKVIRRVPLASLALVLFVALKFVLLTWILRVSGLLERPRTLPLVLAVAMILYLLMVQGRLLGLLYGTARDRLAFLIEDED